MTESQNDRLIEVHGHRGSRGTHVENTLPAFAEAFAAEAEFFELDLQWSVDDQPIVFHDPTIRSKPLRSMPALDIVRLEGHRDRKFPQRAVPGSFIPTFDEVLRWQSTQRKIGVNVEIKMDGNPPEPEFCGRRVIELLKIHRLLHRAQVQSFDFRPLVVVKQLVPEMRLSCLFEEKADFIGEAQKTGAGIVGPNFRLLDKATVDACHAAGLKVMPWTANEPTDWRALVDMGVDGIITDYPRLLRAWLRAPSSR